MSTSFNINIYETLVRHASDLVHWIEGSGPVLQESRPLAGGFSEHLEFTLIDAPLKLDPESVLVADRTPSDLSFTHKPGTTVLWRLRAKDNETLTNVQKKTDSADLLKRPVEDGYKVSGTVSDKQRRINPREFNLVDVGNFIDVSDPAARGHEVKLYRSPLGTQMGSLGGLQGRVLWDTGEAASWAIITCQVTLKHTTGTRSYSAQADINGDFRLAFASLPFPKKEGDSRPPYACKLSIAALKSVSGEEWHQPDDFISAELKKFDADEFNASIDLNFEAGKKQRLKSFGSDELLILKPTA